MDEKEIKDIYEQATKELYQPVKRKFQRRKVMVYDVDDVWSCDLVEMPEEWRDDNKGYKYILNCVDVFSKYAWGVPLKNKSAKDVTNAFENVFEKSKRYPGHLWVDQGKEFYNNDMNKLMKKDNNIKMYSTYGEHKSAVVERFNRTLKNMMFPVLTINNNHDWIDILPDLINKYNNKKHSSIKMTPIEALKKENKEKVFRNLYYRYLNSTPPSPPSYSIGDRVRVSKVKKTFEKGYLPNFSEEIFKVSEVLPTNPICKELLSCIMHISVCFSFQFLLSIYSF